MPEAQAPAPAPSATPAATSAEPTQGAPVSAPGAAQTPAKPEPKKTGKARHAEIRAKLTASKAAAPAQTGDRPADSAATPAAKTEPGKTDSAPAASTEPEKAKPAVGAVMRLTAENTKLARELEDVRGKLEAASKGESIASLRERVKNDPAVIFDVFGEDLDADENARLTKLNDAVLARLDPASAAERERDARIATLEKERDEERRKNAERDEQDRARSRREHTAKVLTEGFKDEIGETIVDAAKYPWVNHLTKVGEVDVHAGISATVRDLVVEFQKAQKRNPSDAEIAKFIAISAEQAEEHFAKRAKNWSLPSAAPAPAATPPAPERRPTPTTIGSALGSRAPAGVDVTKLSKKERHALIRQRLRDANRQAAPN
jgi:hypothetical protein